WTEVTEWRYSSKRHVRLADADLASQVRTALALEDVVHRKAATHLFIRLRRVRVVISGTAETSAHIQELSRQANGDIHAITAGSARLRNQRSNQSMKAGISGSLADNAVRRAVRSCSRLRTTSAHSRCSSQKAGTLWRTLSQSWRAHRRARYRSTPSMSWEVVAASSPFSTRSSTVLSESKRSPNIRAAACRGRVSLRASKIRASS